MPNEHILHLQDVYKGYDGKVILRDIDLAISEGEFCSVVGPSGCGKSTLLRLILGQELPDSGSIHLEGKLIGTPDPRRGVVYQKYSLFPHMTVLQNVMLGPSYLGLDGKTSASKKEIEEKAMYYLKRVRLEHAAHKYPHELSGGMQQRAAIAQTLIVHPKILLMDEPFGALDPDTREQLQVFLLELWESMGLTILFITHSLEEACFVGSRLLALSQYYDSGDDKYLHGATIVEDHPLMRVAHSTEIKQNPQFQELIASVKSRAFDPSLRQHIHDFNLKHIDSFRTN
ncbi:ABC transporter ATP-binding protein [Photobacterium angustum]|uniref:ABC transporter ATP-binding protein n=1 Tax=Photobacterium angustum TaxID=661 RepID=UPI0005DDBC67|nr:ABC transporter ATP-binding protein [Photobacterium angustum]KJG01974.1 nitrate ABC transporter ATPase [Photobacterium angustum]KJG16944.1 nitrate ABC transporter ATPase [Photobacterium angustum]KJG24232.1 nitrate ABC transporter ATPase [Photobacterium angustum]KJG31835.1 nitrate ABC transporter ATPase [Photobacterium angustum]PSV69640.1 ABC transporter ATP-binding protein [Photobacterium angustum]